MLPGYDEAIAQSMKQQPPPTYQVAMSNAIPVVETNTSAGTTNGPVTVILPPASPSTSATAMGISSPPPYPIEEIYSPESESAMSTNEITPNTTTTATTVTTLPLTVITPTILTNTNNTNKIV